MKRPLPKKAANTRAKTQNNAQEDENGGQMDNDLHELFLDELADVYNAEQQLTKALPRMAKAAESDELREAFESHLEETTRQAERLEEVVEKLGESLKRKTCAAMKGLVEEAQELMKEQKDSSALDAALIAAAQKVEHYEIASYGTLCAWAKQMGHDEALELLEETLEEEKAADENLTTIAESIANARAESEE
jgi:ferritin-like metal-binding protein YciE